jgi:hypothetical protein
VEHDPPRNSLKEAGSDHECSVRRFNFDRLQRTALTKLSPPDRDLVQEVLAGRDLTEFIATHGSLWGSWERPLSETMDELRFPLQIIAVDLLM